MATILPPGETTFFDANGNPLASGTVAFYIPNTSTPKNTYQDAGASILNTNPVVLDAGGRAIIYGTGQYRQVVKDASGNTIWDQLTQDISTVVSLWCGSATGTGNAIILSPSPVVTTLIIGQTYAGMITSNNSGPTTLQISAIAAKNVNVNSSSGLGPLQGGELVSGNVGLFLWNGTVFILQNPILITILPGTIINWSANTPPNGYFECNGAAVSRTTYSVLFSVTGTTFGIGDGTTTFNLPDMRGYFARGWDDGAGVDPMRAFGSTQADEFSSHTHMANITDPGHNHTQLAGNDGSNGTVVVGSLSNISNTAPTDSATTGISVANSNTGGSETVPKNVALMFCIKY